MNKLKFEEALALETLAGSIERAAQQAHLSTKLFEEKAAEERKSLGAQIEALFPDGHKRGRPLVRYNGKTYTIRDGAIVETPVENLDQ